MEVHRPLRNARRARGEADQADVVGGGVAGLERLALARQPRLELLRPERQELARPSLDRPLQLAAQGLVDEGERDLRLIDHDRELLGAQQRHGGDDDAARLQDGEVDRRHHRAVRRAKEHPVAGHEPLAREPVRQPVHQSGELGVGPREPVPEDRDALAAPLCDVAVDELDGDVEAFRVAEPVEVDQRGPSILRRKVLARERVDVAAAQHGAHSAAARRTASGGRLAASTCRAMMIF